MMFWSMFLHFEFWQVALPAHQQGNDGLLIKYLNPHVVVVSVAVQLMIVIVDNECNIFDQILFLFFFLFIYILFEKIHHCFDMLT